MHLRAALLENRYIPIFKCVYYSCAQSGDLGEKTAGFTVGYHVSDEENDAVAVTEILDGTPKRTFQAGEGTNSFAVTGEAFMKLSNGPHAMLIQASDGKATATAVVYAALIVKGRKTLDPVKEILMDLEVEA